MIAIAMCTLAVLTLHTQTISATTYNPWDYKGDYRGGHGVGYRGGLGGGLGGGHGGSYKQVCLLCSVG